MSLGLLRPCPGLLVALIRPPGHRQAKAMLRLALVQRWEWGVFERSTSGAGVGFASPLPPRCLRGNFGYFKKTKDKTGRIWDRSECPLYPRKQTFGGVDAECPLLTQSRREAASGTLNGVKEQDVSVFWQRPQPGCYRPSRSYPVEAFRQVSMVVRSLR